ncbi:MAG: hypothetical protein ACQEQO_09035 [Thermodesulfobacteriota bacterium]
MVFAEMPCPDPDALWEYITKDSAYTEWSFWSDHQGMQPGRAPQGPLHKVYGNSRSLNSAESPVQYGAIQVKEDYSTSRELTAITAMYKVPEYNPKDGDWFWRNIHQRSGQALLVNQKAVIAATGPGPTMILS